MVKMNVLRSLTLLTVLMVPALAHAQDQRLRVSLGGATTAGAIDAHPALLASVGYRFASRLSFDVDVTATEGSPDRFSEGPFFGLGMAPADVIRPGSFMGDRGRGVSPLVPGTGIFAPGALSGMPFSRGDLRAEHETETILTTFGLRYDLPTQVERFVPYVTGGIGLARTESEFSVSLAPVAPVRLGAAPALPRMNFDEARSHVGLATGAGIGTSVRIFRQLSADLDARYFRLSRGRNIGRFGGGVSYRF